MSQTQEAVPVKLTENQRRRVESLRRREERRQLALNIINTCRSAGVPEFPPASIIFGTRRDSSVMAWRRALSWILRHRYGFTFPQIGFALNRDHATIHDQLLSVQACQERPGNPLCIRTLSAISSIEAVLDAGEGE